MAHPSFKRRLLRKRPSAAMIVAVTALFLALGGGAYAAAVLPNNSITNAMLKNNSVGFKKMRADAVGYQNIKPGSVGTVRIDQQEVQERVKGTCTVGSEAISTIAQKGTVTCSPTTPSEYDSGTGSSVALTSSTTAATVASYALAGGTSYIVQADPYVSVTPGSSDSGADQVTVSCELAAGTATTATQTRSVTVDVTGTGGSGAPTSYASIPLTVAAPSSANSETADVTCTSSPTSGNSPTVDAQATIYALQTSSNTSATTTTTTTTG